MRILVLGGYGLIGSSIIQNLLSSNHDIVGLGRSAAKGKKFFPDLDWIGIDLKHLADVDAWRTHLKNIDIVVNASGILQSTPGDDIKTIQQDSIIALIKACEIAEISKYIQISAPDAQTNSTTSFFRTKAHADNFLKESALKWTIFRPGLVISEQSYGGTSLIRTLAAIPLIHTLLHAEKRIQTVYVNDVARAVRFAIDNDCALKDFDLVEPNSHSLSELVLSFRRWLHFAPPILTISFPASIGKFVSILANGTGLLGWRSPLRSNALKVLDTGVTGNSCAWTEFSGIANSGLTETLGKMPSNIQERIFARSALCFPILVLILSSFWIVSGLIGLFQYKSAMNVFEKQLGDIIPAFAVFGGAFLDIIIGLAVLHRATIRLACLCSIAVCGAYMIGSALFASHLWLDPLGPMVKVFPAIGLAIITAALVQDR